MAESILETEDNNILSKEIETIVIIQPGRAVLVNPLFMVSNLMVQEVLNILLLLKTILSGTMEAGRKLWLKSLSQIVLNIHI